MRNRTRIAALFLALPGVVSVFLPLIPMGYFPDAGAIVVSPVDVVMIYARHFSEWRWSFKDLQYALLALPFFLAIAIVAWQACRLAARRPSGLAIAVAYVLSGGVMMATFAFVAGSLVWDKSGMRVDGEAMVRIGAFLALATVNVVLLWRNHARRVARETAAELFLLGGYLPWAVLSLSSPPSWWRLSHLRVGEIVFLIACLGYLVSIVLALRAENAQQSPALPVR